MAHLFRFRKRQIMCLPECNRLRPRQNDRHSTADTFRRIFLRKMCSFNQNLTDVSSEGSHERIVIISLDNGL